MADTTPPPTQPAPASTAPATTAPATTAPATTAPATTAPASTAPAPAPATTAATVTTPPGEKVIVLSSGTEFHLVYSATVGDVLIAATLVLAVVVVLGSRLFSWVRGVL